MMDRSLPWAIAMLLAAGTSALPFAQQVSPENGLEAGRQRVGFTTSEARDQSQRGPAGPKRFQVACWYPATASATQAHKPMSVGDYLALSAGDDPGAPRADAVAEYRKLLVENGVDGDLVTRWVNMPATAHRGAPRAPGTAPLVLVAQGNAQSGYHQALLSELLASDGFVVCTVPSPARLQGPMRSERDILPYATAQATLLEEAARIARRVLRAADGPPGLVGHSFGARAALVYAGRRPTRALVSLDGGIGFATGRDWMQGQQSESLASRFTTPVLHIYETDDPAAAPDFSLLESLTHSPRLLLRIEGLRHIDFTSAGFASRSIPGIFGEAPASVGPKLSAIAMYTRSFLRALLLDDAGARALLQAAPGDRGWPWMSVRRLPAASERR